MANRTKEVEILLIEDNLTDAELAIRALKKSILGNNLVWVKDGAESYHLGVNSYICKPVAFDEFVKVVSQLGIYWVLVNQRRRW